MAIALSIEYRAVYGRLVNAQMLLRSRLQREVERDGQGSDRAVVGQAEVSVAGRADVADVVVRPVPEVRRHRGPGEVRGQRAAHDGDARRVVGARVRAAGQEHHADEGAVADGGLGDRHEERQEAAR